MQTNSLKLISQFNTLREQALENSPGFLDGLCNFLVDEFQFQSSILFKLDESNHLLVLGKSATAKKTIQPKAVFDCGHCRFLKNGGDNFDYFSEPRCEVQSSEYVQYEACQLLKTTAQGRYILKVAQKTPFTRAEKEYFDILGNFIVGILNTWGGGEFSQGDYSVSKVVVDIANELRTPSNSVMGFASLLNEARLTSTQAEYVSEIKENAQKAIGLINDLIDYAKIDAGVISVQNQATELSGVISDTVAIFQEKLTAKKIEVESSVDASIGDMIKIDGQKLRTIVYNFLAYFVAVTEQGKVSIAVSKNDRGVLNFKFTNSGSVIPLSSPKLFFSPQFLIDNKALKLPALTVLGISLSKKYIELLKGDVEVSLTAGKGTLINFTVPTEAPVQAAGTPAPIEQQISMLPKVDGNNAKVLVIEDDYATSRLLSNYLNKWGYEPFIVNSGQKAMQLVQKDKFLAIIMDIILPDINGLELIKKLREQDNVKNTPIIVCSVEAEQQKAFMLGAVEYFVKPIKYKDLVEVLTSYKLKKDSNVLCVDDDEPTLNLVKGAIESVGFRAIAELHSGRVMERIKDIQIDLAIVDLDMPELSGFDLIKLIKSNPKFANLPIIIYTGKENFQEDLKKIDGLFTELLDKRSTKIEELADTINAMINRYEEPTPPEEVSKEPDLPKILLVEDYKHSQIIVTRLLKKNNFTSVVVVENGAEAVEQAKQQKFDLILMDMQMPVMNGFEATERIRQMVEYKNTPIIALTAFAMKGDREKCIEAGATDYIPKPIDSVEFIEKVKHYTSLKLV